jgi:uncharacterized protein YcfL
MKNILFAMVSILLLNSCNSHNGINPAQNSALISITSTKKHKGKAAMQKH